MAYEMKTKLSLEQIIAEVSGNLCKYFEPDELNMIGGEAREGYDKDLISRSEWEIRQAEANKLALQVYEQKVVPWLNASSVKFPLITVAALQYHAKAYPSLVSGVDLVKCRVIGQDPDGEKAARAKRVSTHMSWQNLEQDPAWEAEHDKMLLVQGIAGCAFKKLVFEPGPARQVSMLVLPENIVINYFTLSLIDSPRFTHTFFLDANKIRQRELDGRFHSLKDEQGRETTEPVITADDSEIKAARQEAQGTQAPEVEKITPYFTGEQYCWWDFDGDGYEEPYIVTFDVASAKVRRIQPRFLPSMVKFLSGKKMSDYSQRGEDGKSEYDIPRKEEVYRIEPVHIFTKYGFIPSPDGGFYDIGLGSILGPLNATVNTTINQMLDAGTMSMLGGGFLGRGFKDKGGPIAFRPNTWFPVDAPGDDLRKNILPLPTKEPSAVLFQLLGLLLQYSERIVSATDIQMGENPGQNTPAETTRTLNENGARVYNAIYKRTWRAMRDEFRIQYALNKIYLIADEDFEDLTTGKGAMVRAEDYEGPSQDVRPAADPHIVSDTQALDQAKMLVQMAEGMQGFNRYKSRLRLLTAMRIPNIEEVMPPPQGPDPKDPSKMVPLPDFPPMPNPKMLEVQVKQGLLKVKELEFQAEQKERQIELMTEAQEAMARIENLKAQAAEHMAKAKATAEDPVIKMMFASIEAQEKDKDRMIEMAKAIGERMDKQNEAGDAGSPMGGMATPTGNAGSPGMAKPNGRGAQAGLAGATL